MFQNMKLTRGFILKPFAGQSNYTDRPAWLRLLNGPRITSFVVKRNYLGRRGLNKGHDDQPSEILGAGQNSRPSHILREFAASSLFEFQLRVYRPEIRCSTADND